MDLIQNQKMDQNQKIASPMDRNNEFVNWTSRDKRQSPKNKRQKPSESKRKLTGKSTGGILRTLLKPEKNSQD